MEMKLLHVQNDLFVLSLRRAMLWCAQYSLWFLLGKALTGQLQHLEKMVAT